MTTKTQEPPATAEKKKEGAPAIVHQPAKVLFAGDVRLDLIDVVSNVRKKFDENAIKELAANIKQLGRVISPVTLRPSKPGRHELVAGERRIRAARLAGMTSIAAQVLELNDQQAMEYQAAENIHRKDLMLIEEARAFKTMLDSRKYNVEQLAQLIGKSKVYVYRSVSLLELPAKAIDAIESGELSPAHGHQILRVPAGEREKLVKEVLENGHNGRVMTAAELREHVEQSMGYRLDTARFPKDKPFAGADACTGCPSNSGNHGMLFDGAEKGRCMNRQCYAKKVKQQQADFLEKTTLAHLDAKFIEYGRGGQIYVGMFRPGGYSVKGKIEKATKLKGEYGIIIDPCSFEIYYAVCDRKEEKQSGRVGPSAPKPADPKAEFVAEAVAHAIYDAAAEAAKKLKMEHKDWVELAKAAANDLPNELWAGILGVPPDEGDDGDFAKASEATLRAIVLVSRRLPYQPADADWRKLGVDVAAVKKEATAEAEQEFIDFKASKGITWPKNIAQVDKAILAAVHNIEGAADRWAKDKKTGLSESQMTERVKYELPSSGGGSSKELIWNAKQSGFKVWLGSMRAKPSIQGHETVARVRILLQIPYL